MNSGVVLPEAPSRSSPQYPRSADAARVADGLVGGLVGLAAIRVRPVPGGAIVLPDLEPELAGKADLRVVEAGVRVPLAVVARVGFRA